MREVTRVWVNRGLQATVSNVDFFLLTTAKKNVVYRNKVTGLLWQHIYYRKVEIVE